MDTSLAEEVQQTMATLAPNRFFLCRRTAVLRRQDVSPASMNRL
ncbi:hypothetical protein OHD25_01785 [Escherichia coli]|nr:hypothetical protein [Escherichia coli]